MTQDSVVGLCHKILCHVSPVRNCFPNIEHDICVLYRIRSYMYTTYRILSSNQPLITILVIYSKVSNGSFLRFGIDYRADLQKETYKDKACGGSFLKSATNRDLCHI